MNISPISFINFKGTQKVNKMNVQAQRAFMSQPLKNDTFKRIFETNEYLTTNNIKLYSTRVSNAKKYSLDISKITGSKTGYTGNAGLCLASTATYNNIN